MTLTADNYHSHEANRAYLGIHQFQDWMECQARTRAELAGEDRELFAQYKHDKACFKVGTYTHLAMGEPDKLQAWIDEHRADLLKKTGEKYADFAAADAMVARARREPIIRELLTAGEPEVVVTGEIGGVPWKGRVDWLALAAGLFVDWKTASTFDDGWTVIGERNVKVPWYYDYWGQMAVYREMIRATTGTVCVPYIVGLRKPTGSFPAAVCAHSFEDPEKLEAAYAKIESWVPQVWRWKTGEDKGTACGRCWWCAEKQPLRVTRAEWFG